MSLKKYIEQYSKHIKTWVREINVTVKEFFKIIFNEIKSVSSYTVLELSFIIALIISSYWGNGYTNMLKNFRGGGNMVFLTF